MFEPPAADAVPDWFIAQHACGQGAVHRFLAKKQQEIPSQDVSSAAATVGADTPSQSPGGSPVAISQPAATEKLYAAVKASFRAHAVALNQPAPKDGASGSFQRRLKILGVVKDFRPRGESASDPFMRLCHQASYEESVRNCDGRLPLALRRAATLKTIHLTTVPQAPSLSPEANMRQIWRDRAEPDERRETTLRMILRNKASPPEPCFEAGDESSTRSAPGSPTRSSTGARSTPRTSQTRVAAPLAQALRPSRRPTTARATNAPSSVSPHRGASEILRPKTENSQRRSNSPPRTKFPLPPTAYPPQDSLPPQLDAAPHSPHSPPRIPGVINGSKRREGFGAALSILLSLADTPGKTPCLRRPESAAASKPWVLKVSMDPMVAVYPFEEFPCDAGG
ncbi:hypothetical protein T484DRAFT_1783062 [Baffinella frigidus]|nr:hypothetical protein T484DRAFT_1783062 [Cryptophyta sp. CCMP2293]